MLKLQVEDTSMRAMFARLRRNMGPGFVNFWDTLHKYIEFRTDQMFARLKHGGSWRGVTWEPFHSAFVARGGTRVTKAGRTVRKMVPASQASLMQDTMNLRRNAANHVFQKSATTFEFGSNVQYAAKQDAMRRFLFWDTPTDLTWAMRMATKFILGGGQ